MSKFKRSLESGNLGEQFVLRIMADAGIECFFNQSLNRSDLAKYDLCCEGLRPFTVEVKFDLMEAKTGNIAVEYWNVKQGKPSGILATKSDLWVVVLRNPLSAWLCKTDKLRKWFATANPLRDVKCGGDDNAAIKLYQRDELFVGVPFYQIDTIESTELSILVCDLLSDD